VNDIRLIGRLRTFDDDGIKKAGLKMMLRHSWYLSPELAALALFSMQLTNEEKTQIVENITPDRGSHFLTKLPASFSEVHISKTFFEITQIDDDFLKIPAMEWPAAQSFKEAVEVSKLVCVNDCAERGVKLIEDFNLTTTDETQKQYLLQVVEAHRKTFHKCNLKELGSMYTDKELHKLHTVSQGLRRFTRV
jgi:hypothetical protein